MKKIGVSILTFKNGEKNGTFFNAIISNIKNQSNIYELTIIDFKKHDIKKYLDIKFDLIITWSYFNKISVDSEVGNYRKLTEMLNYKNILYVESPICDLLPNKFRLNINSIYFYKNEIQDINYEANLKIINKINILSEQAKQTNILLLLQNYKQYFFDNYDLNKYQEYINNIIIEIRKYSKKKIIVRLKPVKSENKYEININDPFDNFEISKLTFHDDLLRSYKCIAHSTNAVSKAIFYNLDIVCLSEYNLAYGYGENDFTKVDSYMNHDYTNLKKKILASGYSKKDLSSKTFISCINKILF